MRRDFGQYYEHVWCVDFEYYCGPTGADAPRPICVVAHDMLSGRTLRRWLWKST